MPSTPLKGDRMGHDPLTLSTILTGVVLAAFILDRRYKSAQHVSPGLLILTSADLLSNTGLITLAMKRKTIGTADGPRFLFNVFSSAKTPRFST